MEFRPTPVRDTRIVFSMVILPSGRTAVNKLLPTGLSPIRAGRGTAPSLAAERGVSRRRRRAIDPYDEFVVVLGATTGGSSGTPYVSPVVGTVGYVWYVPVTHQPARAFGDEMWGHPTVVRVVNFEEYGGTGARQLPSTAGGYSLRTWRLPELPLGRIVSPATPPKTTDS